MDTPTARKRGRIAVVTAAASLGFAVVQLDGSILNVALPQIAAAFATGLATMQWTVDAYLLVFAALLLSAGELADRIGSKRAFIAGFVIFAVSSGACAMAATPVALIAFRAVQGLGGALLVPCSLALINHASGDDAAARSRAIGIWTASGGVALAAGPVVSGLLLGTLGWRSIFVANLPIAALGIWLASRSATATVPTPHDTAIDPVGQVLAIMLLTAIVGVVIEAGSLGWTAPLVIALMVATSACGVALLAVERRVRDPAIPLEFFKDTTFSVATLAGFLVSLAIYGLSFALSLYFQTVLLYTPAETGWAFVPFAASITVSNLLGGWIAARAGARLPMLGGLGLAAAGFALLGSVIGNATFYGAMLPAQLLLRFGIGLAVPPMTAALLATVPRSRSGSASGLLNAIRQAGAAIGVALFGALIRGDMVAGLRIGVMVAAGLLAVAAAASAIFLRTGERTADRRLAARALAHSNRVKQTRPGASEHASEGLPLEPQQRRSLCNPFIRVFGTKGADTAVSMAVSAPFPTEDFNSLVPRAAPLAGPGQTLARVLARPGLACFTRLPWECPPFDAPSNRAEWRPITEGGDACDRSQRKC